MTLPIPDPPLLTGSNSRFPYKVDAYEYASNFISAEPGLEGDVVSAAYRNRIADSIIQLETELLGIPTPTDGDLRVVCLTKTIVNLQFEVDYYITIPKEKADFLDNRTTKDWQYRLSDFNSMSYQFGVRPVAANVAMFNVAIVNSAMLVDHDLEYVSIPGSSPAAFTDRVRFRLLDPGHVWRNSMQALGKTSAGNFIASIILTTDGR